MRKKNKLAEVVVKLVGHMVVTKTKGLAELVEGNGEKEVLVGEMVAQNG